MIQIISNQRLGVFSYSPVILSDNMSYEECVHGLIHSKIKKKYSEV